MEMRHLVLAALALLVGIARASHIETVFTLSMPYAEVDGRPPSIFGDVAYLVCGPYAAVIEAVNLTSRSNMWTSPNFTATYGGIETFTVTGPVVLIGFGDTIVALSSRTGQQLWMQTGYQLGFPATAFINGSDIYAQVITPLQADAVQAFDLATGVPGYFLPSVDLQVDGSTAFVSQPTAEALEIRAIDIPSNTTLWVVSPVSQSADIAAANSISAISSEYVVFSNTSGLDEIAVVLHRRNGSVAHALKAFNGFAYAVQYLVVLQGNVMFAHIGIDEPRYVLVDLTTGYITWTRTVREAGYYPVLSSDAVLSLSPSLVLTATLIGNDSPFVSIPHVPTLPYPTIVDYGNGLVRVENLQGYTFWDINTGELVARNEQDPNQGYSAPPKWNGLSIVVSGNVLSAVTFVR